MRKLLHAFLLCAACGSAAAGDRVFSDPELQAQTMVTGLGTTMATYDTSFVFLDRWTILVVNRSNGMVRRVNLGGTLPATPGNVVLDLDIISAGTAAGSEYGVQSITRHPDFATNGYIYIRYDKSLVVGADTPSSSVIHSAGASASSPTLNVIERYVWNPNANEGNGQLVFDCLIHSAVVDSRYHHGGPLVFDGNGHLFAVYGELRRTTNTGWNANTAGPLLSTNTQGGVVEDHGTIIRLNTDGTIPSDNPFIASGIPGTATWFAYGIRNSFGLAVDPLTGSLWATDNGETSFDEVNRIISGMNGGWKRLSGPVKHPSQTGSTASLIVLPNSTYVDPAFSWKGSVGVTAIHFLHGSNLGSSYDDAVIVTGFNGGHLWLLRLSENRNSFVFSHPGLQDRVDDRPDPFSNAVGTEAEEIVLATGLAPVLSIQRGPDGWPYFLTTAGTIQRLRLTSLYGDMNHDAVVDSLDRAILAYQFGLTSADPQFNVAADLNSDGVIDELDVHLFNELSPPCPEDCRPSNPNGSIGDGVVSIADVLAILHSFGSNSPTTDVAPPNINGSFGDGVVSVGDVIAVLTAFGPCP